MAESTCSIDGCGAPVTARGWCNRHYRRFMRTGDPLSLLRTRAVCSIDLCEREHAAKGYCELHYWRWRRTGDPGPAVLPPLQKEQPCSAPGCDRTSRTNGYCHTHAERRRLGRPLEAPIGKYSPRPKGCQIGDCGRPVIARGMCSAHYARPDDPAPVGSPGRPPSVPGGLPTAGYGPGWHRAKAIVRDRDNQTCRSCGATEGELGSRLPVAHLVPVNGFIWEHRRLAHHPANLILLCPSCHSRFDNSAETRWDYVLGGRLVWPEWTANPVDSKVDMARQLLAVYGTDTEQAAYAEHSPIGRG